MRKFREDWQGATKAERWRYLLYLTLTISFGVAGIIFVLLFAASDNATGQLDYRLSTGAFFFTTTMLLVSRLERKKESGIDG